MTSTIWSMDVNTSASFDFFINVQYINMLNRNLYHRLMYHFILSLTIDNKITLNTNQLLNIEYKYITMWLWFTVIFILLNISLGTNIKYKDDYRYWSSLHVSQLLDQFSGHAENNICCITGQWESNGYLDYGAAISVPETTSYFHYNGTGMIAYDGVDKKSYIKFRITAYSPQIPVYSQFTTTTIKDFHEVCYVSLFSVVIAM